MGYSACYWCGVKCQVCPACQSMDDIQPGCGRCNGTGFLCEEHDTNWIGSVYCPPDREPIIDNWITMHTSEPLDRGENLSIDSLPARSVDELSYMAFICDLNAALPGLNFTYEGLTKVAVFKRIRDLAVHAGGMRPNVLRAGQIAPIDLPAGASNAGNSGDIEEKPMAGLVGSLVKQAMEKVYPGMWEDFLPGATVSALIPGEGAFVVNYFEDTLTFVAPVLDDVQPTTILLRAMGTANEGTPIGALVLHEGEADHWSVLWTCKLSGSWIDPGTTASKQMVLDLVTNAAGIAKVRAEMLASLVGGSQWIPSVGSGWQLALIKLV